MKTRKLLIGSLSAAFLLMSATGANARGHATGVECNWGLVTKMAIEDGFPQGQHASDPSGDGKGKGDADQPRAGLANVLERGNLQALCEFISGELGE